MDAIASVVLAQSDCDVRTNLGDILKAFTQVWLDSSRIFGLGQNLQKLIIWQEVKPENKYEKFSTIYYVCVISSRS